MKAIKTKNNSIEKETAQDIITGNKDISASSAYSEKSAQKTNDEPVLNVQNEPPADREKTTFRKILAFLKKMLRSVWFWLLMLTPLAFLLRILAEKISGFADFYNQHIYRYISIFWTNISGIVPFSIGEILLILLPAAGIAYIIAVIVSVVKSKGKRLHKVFMGIVRPVSAASLVFFLFMTNCGINYFCQDVRTQSGLEFREPSAEELYEVCIYLADKATECRSKLPEDENGVVKIDISSARTKAKNAMNSLHSTYEYIPDGYSIPKSVMLSRGMSFLQITGVYFPFTFEANVNTDVPAFSVPFTMCHELAHVRGFMHEQDANFLAYLACIYSGEEDFMYSGYSEAVRYVSRHLRKADSKLYADFQKHLSDGVYRDYAFDSKYWKQFETPIAQTAAAVNDSYLKQNAQPQGIKSYDMITGLIIAHYFQEIKHYK